VKTFKRILAAYKYELIIALATATGFAIIGNLIHDMLIRYVPDDDMTVFPLGTLLTIISFFMVSLLVGLFSDGRFNATIAMGETRHRFFKDLIITRLLTSMVYILMIELAYKYEQWKFTAKYPQYTIDLEMRFLYNALFIVILLLGGTCLSVLLTSLVLRFEKKAYIAVWIFFMTSGFTVSRILDPVLTWAEDNAITINTAPALAVTVLLCILMIGLSRRMIFRLSVK